jgi:hypothetical protein
MSPGPLVVILGCALVCFGSASAIAKSHVASSAHTIRLAAANAPAWVAPQQAFYVLKDKCGIVGMHCRTKFRT